MNRPPKKLDQKSNDWKVGFFMAKYSFEFKKNIVQAYLNGEGDYEYLAHKYEIRLILDIGKYNSRRHNFVTN